jgi:hypothetical protein
MTSRSKPHREEVITIRQPIGTEVHRTEEALRVARAFVTEHIDMRAGLPHVYSAGERRYAVWWTKARGVSVRVL